MRRAGGRGNGAAGVILDVLPSLCWSDIPPHDFLPPDLVLM